MYTKFHIFFINRGIGSFCILSSLLVWGTICCESSNDGQSSVDDAGSSLEENSIGMSGTLGSSGTPSGSSGTICCESSDGGQSSVDDAGSSFEENSIGTSGTSGSSGTPSGSSGTICCESSDGGQSSVDDAGSSFEENSTDTSGRIYVAITGRDEIAVINEETQEVIDNIPVGVGPTILLATPDRSKLYTANWTDDTVSAVVVATAETKNIQLPGRPYVIAMANDGKYLYAGLSNNRIAVLDLEKDEVERFIFTPGMPMSIIVSSDNQILYVAELNNTLRAISAATGEIIHEPITVGITPAWITISPDGSKVYTLNYLSDDITVVDTDTFTVETSIPTGVGGNGIIGNVTPDGSMLYVANVGSGDFIGIDTDSNEIVKRIELDGRPVGIISSQDGKRVYVTDYGVGSLDSMSTDAVLLLTGVFTPRRDGQVSIFDTETDQLIGDKIQVGPGPSSIVAFSP